jgi:GGDEF domain-containing protein
MDATGVPSTNGRAARSPILPTSRVETVADVMKRAETALHRAKHDGRNRVVATAA